MEAPEISVIEVSPTEGYATPKGLLTQGPVQSDGDVCYRLDQLDKLIVAFIHPVIGVSVRNRRKRFKLYKEVFVGNQKTQSLLPLGYFAES